MYHEFSAKIQDTQMFRRSRYWCQRSTGTASTEHQSRKRSCDRPGAFTACPKAGCSFASRWLSAQRTSVRERWRKAGGGSNFTLDWRRPGRQSGTFARIVARRAAMPRFSGRRRRRQWAAMARGLATVCFSESGLRRLPRAQGRAGVGSVLAAMTDFIQRGVLVIGSSFHGLCRLPRSTLYPHCGRVLDAFMVFCGSFAAIYGEMWRCPGCDR